ANKGSKLPPVHSMPYCRWRRGASKISGHSAYCIATLGAMLRHNRREGPTEKMGYGPTSVSELLLRVLVRSTLDFYRGRADPKAAYSVPAPDLSTCETCYSITRSASDRKLSGIVSQSFSQYED